MTATVIVSAEAETQIETIDSWWRANRPASPNLFVEELAEAFSTIEVAPAAGHRYAHADVKGVRRLLLRSTRHHVYYVATTDAAIILAVWGSIKGSGPDLTNLEE